MTQTDAKTLLLLKPRGFCAGVVRAIDIVRIALETFGAPIYVRKEIVHNRYVVDELTAKGAIFVDSVQEVPAGERVIYSAHGVAPEVREASKLRELRVIDATCPLVTKVHVEAVKFAREGYSLVLIGHHDHDEVIGTLGEAPAVTQVVDEPADIENLHVPDPNRVAYLTQTTLSLDETTHVIEALRKKFPNIQGPHAQDICYATENRQTAVKDVANECDLAAGRRFRQQLQFQSPGRSRPQHGHELAPDRELSFHRAGVAGGREDRGFDGRRVGAGDPGAGGSDVPAGAGLHQPARGGSDAGECALRLATGNRGSNRGRAGPGGVRNKNGRSVTPQSR